MATERRCMLSDRVHCLAPGKAKAKCHGHAKRKAGLGVLRQRRSLMPGQNTREGYLLRIKSIP